MSDVGGWMGGWVGRGWPGHQIPPPPPPGVTEQSPAPLPHSNYGKFFCIFFVKKNDLGFTGFFSVSIAFLLGLTKDVYHRALGLLQFRWMGPSSRCEVQGTRAVKIRRHHHRAAPHRSPLGRTHLAHGRPHPPPILVQTGCRTA